MKQEIGTELGMLIERATRGKPGEPLSFETLENAARRCALEVAARVLETALNADHSDGRGTLRPCSCGAQARYAGRRPKTVVTVVGEITIERASYWCEQCRRGFCPRDAELKLGRGCLSTGVLRMVGMTAALASFQETDELLTALAGIRVGTKEVERASEALGSEIAEGERTVVNPHPPRSTTMYLGMDGTGIPMMRSGELAGRSGKQADGSAKTREVKLVTIWSADGRDKDGNPMRDVGSVSYNAAIESAASLDTDEQLSQFASRVEREATRRGFTQAKRRAVIGDGAKWIWNVADELFPGAAQIVDLFHAKGTVSEVAKAIFGAESEVGKQWAKCRRDELEAGKLDDILAALEPHLASHKEVVTCREYLITNRERMRYPEFRSLGLCTSSGVVEAGCKHAIGTWLKRAGMHWTLEGANAIIALRCCKLSDRYDDFWNRRAAG